MPRADGPGARRRSLTNPSPVVDTVRWSGRVVLLASHLDASEGERRRRPQLAAEALTGAA